jgi:HAE1 family hydrophobic/amphiphilic exporter-1
MGLIRFCVRRPVFTWVTVLLACFLGVYSYFKLGVALYPKVDIPVVVVYAAYRGASPGEIEQLVAKPLEDAVSKVEGVKKIESYSLEGFCYVVAELFYEVDLNQATWTCPTRSKRPGRSPKDATSPRWRRWTSTRTPS